MKHDVTKASFSPKFSTNFSEMLVESVNLMSDIVLKVPRSNQPPVLSYHKRQNLPLPHGGARANIMVSAATTFARHPDTDSSLPNLKEN